MVYVLKHAGGMLIGICTGVCKCYKLVGICIGVRKCYKLIGICTGVRRGVKCKKGVRGKRSKEGGAVSQWGR